MANSGVYPLDPLTLVGQFRLGYGDVYSVPFDPVQPGLQDYTHFSDAEIAQFIVLGGDSTNRSIGYAYLQAAGAAAMESKSVKDYDLAVDLTKRAEDLRKIALTYFGLADAEDIITGLAEEFIVVDTGTDRDIDDYRVEGFPYWPGLAS